MHFIVNYTLKGRKGGEEREREMVVVVMAVAAAVEGTLSALEELAIGIV